MTKESMARGLGWASLAIGLSEILVPDRIEKMLGVEHTNGKAQGVLRTLGLREVVHGMDILMNDDPMPGIWGRVAGDMLDGVLLGIAAKQTQKTKSFAGVTSAVMGIVVADMVLAWWGRSSRKRNGSNGHNGANGG